MSSSGSTSVIGSMRDHAFTIYLLSRTGRITEAGAALEQTSAFLSDEPLDAGFWLWATGEYMQASRQTGLLQTRAEQIERALSLIEQHWNAPSRHWLTGRDEAVHLSNIAVYYGAVLSIQPFVGTERTQRLLKTMRELVFARFIKEGKVVSKLGERAVWGDIVAVAVPFGLLGIEDRILIEALYVLEKELVGKGVRLSLDDTHFGGCERSDLSCLLAWYYAEKGDLVKAKKLLEYMHVCKRQTGVLPDIHKETSREPVYYEYWLRKEGGIGASPLADILLQIADHALMAQGLRSSGQQGAGIQIVHEPTGKDDPYVYLPHERVPRHPKAGEQVWLQAVTEPLAPEQQVCVRYRVNGGDWASQPMNLETAAGNEKVWRACIGRFETGQEVEYRIVAEDESGQYQSGSYRFITLYWHGLGQVRSLQRTGDTIEVHFSAQNASAGSEASLKLAASGGKLKASFELASSTSGDDPFRAGASRETIRLPGTGHELIVSAEENRLDIRLLAGTACIMKSWTHGGKSAVELLTDGQRIYRMRLNLEIQSGDCIYGMGERFWGMEYRGLEVDNYVYNEYRDQGLKTYMPVPFFINSGGYGMYLDSNRYSKFSFGSRLHNLLELEAEVDADHPKLNLFLFPGDPLHAIRQFAEVVGKPVLPPKWAFGPWMSSNNWDSQAEVEKQVALTLQHRIPSTVIVLEQWSDEATFYLFNDAQYEVKPGSEALQYEEMVFPEWGRWPDPKGMVEGLHEAGLKVLLWQIPIQKFMYGIAHPQRDADEQFMLDSGYHVKQKDGTPYRIPYNWFKDSLVIDFSNPKARDWWFSKRLYMLKDLGIDGFKTDGGECIFGDDTVFADGHTGAELRNRYPLDYVGSYYDFIQQHVPGGGITFSRAGYSGAQRYPLHWAGDERSTFAAFRHSLNAGLSSSMSGIPFWGWDLGGFHGDIPTAELFIRGTQMAAFCPVMQYHAETKGEFNQDRTPWNISERTGSPEALTVYKKYADLRMNLLPYIYAEAMRSSTDGVPMMRAMVVEFPHDSNTFPMREQYMFGDSLLVAPVVHEGHVTKSVYFPEGRWMSLFTGEIITGSRCEEIRADLDQIPVYMKQNSVLPLNLDSSYALFSHVGSRVDRYEKLSFYIFITERIDYRFADDLGNEIGIAAVREEGQMTIEVSGNTLPVTLIVGGFQGGGCVSGWQRCELPELTPGRYAEGDGKLYIQAAASQQVQRFTLREK